MLKFGNSNWSPLKRQPAYPETNFGLWVAIAVTVAFMGLVGWAIFFY